MKKGDLVRIIGSLRIGGNSRVGMLVGRWNMDSDWWQVLDGDEIITWPESQLILCEER